MSLTAVVGNHRLVNWDLMLRAFHHSPSLVVDCANVANPHAYSAYFPLEKYHDVFVVEVELLYTFRDILKRVPDDMKALGAKTLIVTTFNYLFNYQDEHENRMIYAHAWELLKELSREYDVFVGVKENSDQEVNARRYCDLVEEKRSAETIREKSIVNAKCLDGTTITGSLRSNPSDLPYAPPRRGLVPRRVGASGGAR